MNIVSIPDLVMSRYYGFSPLSTQASGFNKEIGIHNISGMTRIRLC